MNGLFYSPDDRHADLQNRLQHRAFTLVLRFVRKLKRKPLEKRLWWASVNAAWAATISRRRITKRRARRAIQIIFTTDHAI